MFLYSVPHNTWAIIRDMMNCIIPCKICGMEEEAIDHCSALVSVKFFSTEHPSTILQGVNGNWPGKNIFKVIQEWKLRTQAMVKPKHLIGILD